MNDSISREEAIEPKWILVSERLPKDRDWYLGIFKELDTGWINPIPFICTYVGHPTRITTKDFWMLKEHDDEKEFGFEYYHNLACFAWMPLPNFCPNEYLRNDEEAINDPKRRNAASE